MKTTKLTTKQADQIVNALRMHRHYRMEYSNMFIIGAFIDVSTEALKARKVLLKKGLWPEVAAELAMPITRIANCYHIPTREWEQANGIASVTEF